MKQITTEAASRIARHYSAVTPESASWSHNSVWHTEISFKLRRDDGSTWARLGFGPIRKMVTLQFRENSKTAHVSVRVC